MKKKESDMRSPVVAWLAERGLLSAVEFQIWHYVDIVAGRFGNRPSRKVPPLLECVSVELKLLDVAGVISQASSNRHQTHRSYCAMPLARCGIMRPVTLDKFRAAGLGLLAVDSYNVTEIISPTFRGEPNSRIVAKLWRRVRKDYSGVTLEETKP